jgi:NOL1/NOP2/fmu family ribosome biogenesis protein
MKETLKILNKKKIKEILSKLDNQYGFKDKLDYAFFMNPKGKIFLLSKKFGELETDVHINSLGLYFGTIKGSEIRLSVEGSQLIGPKAKKNVISLDNEELREWLRGEDLMKEGDDFVLVKNKKDFFGCGKVINNKLLNFVPKEKRIDVI